jgi:hypothetical protein
MCKEAELKLHYLYFCTPNTTSREEQTYGDNWLYFIHSKAHKNLEKARSATH